MLEIIISDPQRQGTRAPSFRARIFAGPELCRSITPIYEAARQLLVLGYSPDELMVAYHQSTLTAINKPQRIGNLAWLAISEGEKGMKRGHYVADLRYRGPRSRRGVAENAR